MPDETKNQQIKIEWTEDRVKMEHDASSLTEAFQFVREQISNGRARRRFIITTGSNGRGSIRHDHRYSNRGSGAR